MDKLQNISVLYRLGSVRPAATALMLLLCFGTGVLRAQPAESTGAMVYRYAQPGQATLKVNVWGAVRQSGLYEVPTDTDLLDLISMAGGPDIGIERNEERRSIILQLSRGSGGQYQNILQVELAEIAGRQHALPDLQSGDIVTVKAVVRKRFGWRDAMTITTAVGTVTYVALTALRLYRDR